jgi:genome maintenance exonuclease 1
MMAEKVKENISPYISEIWGSEVNLYYPDLYAGTADLVGMWKGKPAILDFKQTNKPKKIEYVTDYYLQLTAYALAHNELYGTNIKEGHILMCSRDLDYQQFDLLPDDFSYWEDQFLSKLEEYYNLTK